MIGPVDYRLVNLANPGILKITESTVTYHPGVEKFTFYSNLKKKYIGTPFLKIKKEFFIFFK